MQNMFEEIGATYQLRNGNDFKIPRFWTVRYGKHHEIHGSILVVKTFKRR